MDLISSSAKRTLAVRRKVVAAFCDVEGLEYAPMI